MTWIAVLFGLLMALDATTTFIALTFFGAVELNPLGPVVSVLGKAVAIVVMLGLLRLANPAWRSVLRRHLLSPCFSCHVERLAADGRVSLTRDRGGRFTSRPPRVLSRAEAILRVLQDGFGRTIGVTFQIAGDHPCWMAFPPST